MLAVVVFHAGIAIPGGFTGVDIFYVISGYLISSLLLREVDRAGSVDLVQFWTRRMRRLVPALALVVTVTLLASMLVLSPLIWGRIAWHAASAMLFVSNLVFPYQGQNYFTDSVVPSPYLHTWSLGIEEQFYVFWPLLILLAVVVARRTRVPARRMLQLLFAGTFVVSLAASIWLTAAAPDWAFYILPTRAWEFAGAALLATVPWGRLAGALPAAAADAQGPARHRRVPAAGALVRVRARGRPVPRHHRPAARGRGAAGARRRQHPRRRHLGGPGARPVR